VQPFPRAASPLVYSYISINFQTEAGGIDYSIPSSKEGISYRETDSQKL